MSSQVLSTDSGMVVVHINPQVVQDSGEGQDNRGPFHNKLLKSFLKVQPKALGTVQIMSGVVMFLFGIFFPSPDLWGLTFWEPLIYISAGSLSVAGELHSCVVKASLGMNVICAMTAGATIVLLFSPLNRFEYMHRNFLLVFFILELIISTCISAFACKGTCETDSTVVNVSLNQVKGYRRRKLSTEHTTTAKGKLAEYKENFRAAKLQ